MLEIIDKLIKDKKIVRPYIGISGINVDQATAKRNDISEGIYVAQVLQNSPASKAGIEKGDIITGIEKTEGEYVAIIDRKEAIRYAIENGRIGDVIILAGKGHETYQEIKGVKYDMDDRVLIAEVLEELKG